MTMPPARGSAGSSADLARDSALDPLDPRALYQSALSPEECVRLIEDDDTPVPMLCALIGRVLDSIQLDLGPDSTLVERTWYWLGHRLQTLLGEGDDRSAAVVVTLQPHERFMRAGLRRAWYRALGRIPLDAAILERLADGAAAMPVASVEEVAVRLARRSSEPGSPRTMIIRTVERLLIERAATEPHHPGASVLTDCVNALLPDVPAGLLGFIVERPWLESAAATIAHTTAVRKIDVCEQLLGCRSPLIDRVLLRNPALADEAAWWLAVRALRPSSGRDGAPANEDVVRFLVDSGQQKRVLASPWVWPSLGADTRTAIRDDLAYAVADPEDFEMAELLYHDGDEDTGLRIIEGALRELVATFARVVRIGHGGLVDRILSSRHTDVRRAMITTITRQIAAGAGTTVDRTMLDRWIRSGAADDVADIRASAKRATEILEAAVTGGNA